MKHLQLMLGSVMLFGLTACQTPKVAIQEQQKTTTNHSLQVDGKIYAAFFQQRAAEYQALSQQAYNVAKLRLDEAIAAKGEKPIAIVSDIDETFLDNSYYAVEMAKQGKTWSQDTWANWTSKGIATPLAGSLEFFQYAASKGVQIFYITNRYEEERPGTLANLMKYNYPLQSPQNLILRSKESSKETRRQNIAKDFDIVLLLGDSLTDFSNLFDNHKSENERAAAVETLKAEFGKRFIVLPNVGYGDWESAIFDYKYDLTQEQKDSIIYEAAKETPSH
ncbi:5'-nucleotidase, lipoprotein e(P4) family [Empedobacter stercoris]|uniref:5'-nucleotidase, lipoprotein e(P4) family n=1 Tax=Empedobacter TaxID=59734 RepID=UPI0021AEE212|nr:MULTISPECIES: 5'-nucleotidase, lipoprotein e(P4) family [Empedobacter]MDM1522850.1 5'-nucleotidase, lipoprotein e(P4) family [Empedobacter sp. 225-1]MDM1542789.1 5'-nucleotidase, lipoprotein e(P4) family [Empedobacter sp. 189-2]UWX67637.1 5'-nucleotidase, lipoprotein e(P4) family [Empedobacter stercoris]